MILSKRFRCGVVAALICFLLSVPNRTNASDNREQLRRTMADIALLNNQLSERKTDAGQMHTELALQIKEIKREIRKAAQEAGIRGTVAALQHPRIRFDLQLVADMQAYMHQYAHRIRHYRVACDRLSYLYQQADDDLKIVNTLSGMKIDALIAQADKVLNAYLDDAQTLVIDPNSMVVDPPETVWRNMHGDPMPK